jgi:hypothetical protein
MSPTLELRRLSATLIFDLEDAFARQRGVNGKHPRPTGGINFSIVGTVAGGNRQPITPSLQLQVVANPSGYHLFFGGTKSLSRSRQTSGLAPGQYVVRVDSDFYQRTERDDVMIPSNFAAQAPQAKSVAPYFFDLQPGYAYPFPSVSTIPGGRGPTLLRGVLRNTDGTGIAGATVQVVNQSNAYTTDDTGQWVLVFPDSQPTAAVTVHFVFPDGAAKDVAGVPLRQGNTNGLPPTALRGLVLTKSGVGIAGASVQVSGQTGQAITRSDGSWFFYFDVGQAAAKVTVTATTPDGRTLKQKSVSVQPRGTAEVPSFQF